MKSSQPQSGRRSTVGEAEVVSEHPRPSSKRARTGSTPADRLIDAAIQHFAAHGYESVSTGMVAKTAGLSQSMVHYHFGNKANLWEAAVQRLMVRRGVQFQLSEDDLKDLDPMTRLKLMIRRLISSNAENPELTRILVHECTSKSVRLRWLADKYMGPGYAAFNEALEEATRGGLIRPVQVRDVTNIIVGAATLSLSLAPLLDYVYDGDAPTSDSLSDTLVDVLFVGLVGR
ncbi:MAG TPA: TetR/AcrR family transcriptional regulator [Pseudolysinimonas sp.]|nr:TetR/AcrR family transcriptional regulator [Pseudolysinimonas sp.]